MGVRRWGTARRPRGLLANVALVVLSALAVVVLVEAVTGIRGAGAAAHRSEGALVRAGRVERRLSDLGAYALARTGDPASRRRYDAARTALDEESERLARTALPEEQATAVRRLVRADDAYARGLMTPLASGPGPSSRTEPGRLAAPRGRAFEDVQRTLGAAERHELAAGRETAVTAAVALLLLSLSIVQVPRAISRPVRGRSASDPLTSTLGAESLAASEDRLRRIADVQGALRRVATLVARGVSPPEVFAAVAAEAGRVLEADHTVVVRFESEETARVVAHWNDSRVPQVMPPLDGRWPIERDTVTGILLSTERPARMSDYERNTTAIGRWAHAMGLRCVVGCPIKVEGRVWGALIMHSLHAEPAAGVTEDRMREFVELVGTAIANAQSRSDLLTSRARVVAAADESRRRIERDLHDGAQQRLVTLALKLRAVQSAAGGPGQAALRERLGGLVDELSGVLDDLQEVSRGIVPPLLTRSGLPPALRSLARRAPLPVRLHTEGVQACLPRAVEVAVYYTVCEALTNVVKHARASQVCVCLALRDGHVRLSIRDDGRGGADLTRGTGLVGLKDRVEALDGRIEVRSPPGAGTALRVTIPATPPPAGDPTPP